MRINELINETESLQERSYQHSRIMYHGTTSEFLRSILKTGLQPQPGQKSWTGPEGANLESLDGVYFAPDIRISARAARAAAEKHAGASPCDDRGPSVVTQTRAHPTKT